MSTADEEPVPRLPRGRGMRFSRAQLMRIAMTAILLAMVVVVARPCASSVSTFVTGFDDGSGSAAKGSASYMPRPGSVDEPGMPKQYETIRGDMTEAEMRAAVERARARAGAASGSAGSAGSGSGSAGSGSAGSGRASDR